MVEIALKTFLCIGIIITYILVLIAATIIYAKILGIKNADDFDYAMTANLIQFYVIVVVIVEKVVQWMT